jgi:hypothetical protein
MKAICVLVTVVAAAMAAGADPAPPEFKFSDFQKPKDKAQASVEDGQAVIRISSSDGIGALTVKAKKGQWPRDVTVLIEGFSNLEQFSVTTDRLRAAVSLKQSGHAELSLRNAKGEFETYDRGGHYIIAGSLNITVEERKEGMAIIFPANLFADTESVKIGWIDAYRR